MKQTVLNSSIELYVRRLFSNVGGDLMVAHDFEHVNRVRKWALIIAKGEGYENLEIVEATALLHDIGLTQAPAANRREHGPIGAVMASEYLLNNSNLSQTDIEIISDAIRYHGFSPAIVEEHLASLGGNRQLLEILRDADNLDAFGAIGLIRAFASRYKMPAYDPADVKGPAWGLSPVEFEKKFGSDQKTTLAPVTTAIDQVNQQINRYDNLHTDTGRYLARAFVEVMKNFILQIEREVAHE